LATLQRTKTFGPADHGRRVSLDTLDSAEYVSGFKYEVIDGRLYVSPQPNVPELLLERWLRRELEAYADGHPDVINLVAPKGRVYLPATRPTIPEPDLAAYADFPLDLPFRQIRWKDVSPCLVIEVLVDGDIDKDLTRNPALYLTLPSVKEYWVVDGTIDPDEPSLIVHRRRGKRWVVTTSPFGSKFTTPLLPCFALVIDPRK
jgi:Uma2 family endonuclease